MKNPTPLKSVIRVLVLLSVVSTLHASENLGSTLSQTGWDKIVGTWIDPETNGKNNRTTFSWKYEGTVLESITQMPNNETTSIFGLNPKTGRVFVFSAGSLGGSSSGEVDFTNGVALFNIAFADHKGNEGELEIKYTLVDDNSMTVTFVMKEPVTIRLVRE